MPSTDTPDTPPLLRLHDATVIKGEGQRALDGVSLEIRAGEHTAILGPNGSGKSSLIKLITRQHYPLAHADGTPSVSIYGRDRWNVAELRQLMGIVSADLHQAFTDGESIGSVTGLDVTISGFFASQGVLPHHEVTAAMRRQGMDALALMEATHLAAKSIAAMSSGEARRIVIARALVAGPRALILDEPTTGLDLLARHQFLTTLRKVAQQGKTIILVTHHIEEIFPEIARVVLLKRGRVFRDGPKQAILTTPMLSDAYDAPIQVQRGASGYYVATPGNAPEKPPMTER